MKVEKDEVIGGAAGAGIGAAGIGAAVVGGNASVITGTLATIGGVAGGGMAAGVVVAAAAPIALAAAGFGIVKGVKYLQKNNEQKNKLKGLRWKFSNWIYVFYTTSYRGPADKTQILYAKR